MKSAKAHRCPDMDHGPVVQEVDAKKKSHCSSQKTMSV